MVAVPDPESVALSVACPVLYRRKWKCRQLF